MDYKIDAHGKKIVVQQFSDLKEKQDIAKGYIQMHNQIAMDNQMPQIDLEFALKKIQREHDKFYGDSKYDGKGALKNA